MIDLSKQQALDADWKVKMQINFTGNLAQNANANGTILDANTTKCWIS